jgi:hypothetical protein
MDTRLWGPSAWRLFHIIAAATDKEKNSDKLKKLDKFMNVVARLLPCRYCSTSLQEFLRSDMSNLTELDLENRGDDVQKWMWKLHNLVNAKLRKQGLITTRRNPQLDVVIDHYHTELEKSCSQLEMPGWDFLFSVIFSQAPAGVITRENAP